MFIQLHTLTSYPSALLNRDDAGFAKTLPFGGTTRTRVSSQCLKYHWRNFNGEHAIRKAGADMSIRSRETFQRRVAQPLIDEGYPEPLVRAVTFALKERLLSDKKAGKRDTKTLIDPGEDDNPWDELKTNQIVVLGAPEVRYLRKVAAEKIDDAREELSVFWDEDPNLDSDTVSEAADLMRDISKRDLKKNLKGLYLAAGLDAALFGRMATSDVLARGDAAIHVAHAFTTHPQEAESDYFSAVDELRRDEPEESGELGAGHINTQELTSGLFYSYVVVDVPLLVSNLEGVERNDWHEADRELAAEVMQRFVHLMTTVSPGAKLGSTAPYAHAQCLLAESGTAQPRTLANAFQEAAPNQNVLEASYEKLGAYMHEMDGMYGHTTARKLAAMGPVNGLPEQVGVDDTTTVPDIAQWTANQITHA
ncbi:MAG: type I-E CRISPR-associated protein Cas7/Cse4/CasC [Bacteroidetes bacterium]|jgi:CRISPR system Cascade subunit CasC|nr:type I-E CRISPR-associated protein Cas7/Cse4/CasC [Bacteroidota bacterium]